jgi:hypothetical protein
MERSDGREGGGAAMALGVQRWRWQRSDGDGGAATAMAMAAQRWGWQWWWRRRMSIALLSLRVAAHLLLPMDGRLLSSPLTSGMYFVISYLVYTFST